MGLTIHYELNSNAASPEQARQIVEQLRQAALDLAMSEVGEVVAFSGTDCNFENAEDGLLRWLLVQARRLVSIGEKYDLIVPNHVIAFTTLPGEECEAANFGLACYPAAADGMATGLSGWSWASFCKTQYASNPDVGGIANFVRCHLTVIRMLDYAKAMGILEAVKDESGFWEMRDIKALVETVGKWNRQIAGMVGQYKDEIGGIIAAPITEFPNFEHLEAEGRDPNKPKQN
jgi:hypothetical protein